MSRKEDGAGSEQEGGRRGRGSGPPQHRRDREQREREHRRRSRRERAEPAGERDDVDAGASSDPDGRVARYDWDFGDGVRLADGGPAPTHVYDGPGTRTVTLTVTDDEGCSTAVVYTGQTASCNGSAAATASAAVTVRASARPARATVRIGTSRGEG